MKKSILTYAFLAMAGLAFTAPANAAIVYNSSDLIVAFSNSGTKAGNTYLVDFGNISDFTLGGSFYNPGNAVVINSGTASGYLSDLTTAGLTGTKVWSIFGAEYTTGNNDIWLSKPNASVAFPNGNTAAASGYMTTMVFSMGTAAAASTVSNSFIQAIGDTNSYASYIYGSNSPVQTWGNYGDTSETSTTGLLALYALTDAGTGSGTKLGTFSFNGSNGQISYTASAVPEPSTYMLMGLGLATMIALRHFNSRKKQA